LSLLYSSLIESRGLRSCEVIRLDCVLMLMDTVSVSSQVRTVAYRMYRTPVQYSTHRLCNVNDRLQVRNVTEIFSGR